MRKAPAALLAAIAGLALPSVLAAHQTQRPGGSEARSSHRARHGSVSSAAHHSPRHSRAIRAHRTKTKKKRPVALIHQNAQGEVVLDRVEIVGLLAHGPFLPAEPQDYPRSPCEPLDAVVEAHLHEADQEEAPEGQAAELTLAVEEEGTGARLARLARQLGSLFHPKSSEAVIRPQDVDLTDLLSQGFLIPVEGVDVEKLRDSFLSSRGRHAQHLAIDIGAPRGTPVLATTDGRVARISRERRGGKAIYQKDATGRYLLFYCHLSRYADALSAGQAVKKGDVIGYVGSTGHVIGGPHLHFSITRLAEDNDNFKAGLAINPYLLFLAGVP